MRWYTGLKLRVAKKRLRFDPRTFRAPVIGELYNDCDGFNHRLVSGSWLPASHPRGDIIRDATYVREDGLCFCGCLGLRLEPAWTAEKVETFRRELAIDNDAESDRDFLAWLGAGNRIADDLGMPSAAFLAYCAARKAAREAACA